MKLTVSKTRTLINDAVQTKYFIDGIETGSLARSIQSILGKKGVETSDLYIATYHYDDSRIIVQTKQENTNWKKDFPNQNFNDFTSKQLCKLIKDTAKEILEHLTLCYPIFKDEVTINI